MPFCLLKSGLSNKSLIDKIMEQGFEISTNQRRITTASPDRAASECKPDFEFDQMTTGYDLT